MYSWGWLQMGQTNVSKMGVVTDFLVTCGHFVSKLNIVANKWWLLCRMCVHWTVTVSCVRFECMVGIHRWPNFRIFTWETPMESLLFVVCCERVEKNTRCIWYGNCYQTGEYYVEVVWTLIYGWFWLRMARTNMSSTGVLPGSLVECDQTKHLCKWQVLSDKRRITPVW